MSRSRVRWLSPLPLQAAFLRRRRESTMRQLSLNTGVDRRTWERTLRKTRIRVDTADRLSVALGYHPAQLWPDWSDI